MKSDLIMAINQICAEKDLPRDVILGAIEEALIHAYRRNCASSTAGARVRIDPETGDLSIFSERQIVEEVSDEGAEISLEDARKINAGAELGGTLLEPKELADFGRIAAQTAKQVILQRIHEAERDALYDYYRQREGELITGTVQSIDYRANQVTISLGKKAEGILAPEDQLPNDRYRVMQTVRSLLAEVSKGTRGPQIRLSRTHRTMLRRLLEREIPEIFSGTVEVKSIAREPGQRSKVAVAASQPGVDPVGSCVGLRGTRIQNIVDELNGEKIDVVEWSSDVRQFISNALSPAKPTDTILIEDGEVRTAIVVVPDRQLSLAIGKEGQNARLAAKLTGWRIDIKSETEAATEGISEIRRQQLQLMKQRSLEAKAAAMPPSDDLLSRAEWLLREKDKTAVTLEQAARMLAEVDAEKEEELVSLESELAPETTEQIPVAEESPAVSPVEPVTAPDAVPSWEEAVEPEVESAPAAEFEYMVDFVPEVIEEEEEGLLDPEKKGAKRSKKATKKRELVFDENLGQVVARKKRKPSRGGWGDLGDY